MPSTPWPVVLLLLTVLASTAAGQDNAPPALALSTVQTSAGVGRAFSVVCSLPTSGCAVNMTAAALQWISPNGTLLSADGPRLVSANGTLSCANASLADSGTYNCTLDPCGLSATASMLVYEMPSYAVSLAVIFSIDGGLAIVAAILCTLSLVLTRKSASGIV